MDSDIDSLIKLSPYPILQVDRDCHLLYHNHAAEKDFSLCRKKKGKDILTHLCDTGNFRLDSEKIQTIETTMGHKQYSVTIVPSENKNSFNIYALDITLQKKNIAKINNLAKFPSESPSPVMRLKTDGTLLYANKAATAILKLWFKNKERKNELKLYFKKALENIMSRRKRTLFEIRVNDTYYLLSMVPVLEEGYVNVYASDITSLKKAQENLKLVATQDYLTQLKNRKSFFTDFDEELAYSKKHHLKFLIMIIDIDYFKQINDYLGHDIGDQFLLKISSWLKNNTQKSDILARIGGDEFAIILKNVSASKENFNSILNRLLSIKAHGFKLANHELFASLTIGYSLYPDDGKTKQDLFKKADIALYQAKKAGRGLAFGYHEVKNIPKDLIYDNGAEPTNQIEVSDLDLVYHPIFNVIDKTLFGLYLSLGCKKTIYRNKKNQRLFEIIASQQNNINIEEFIFGTLKESLQHLMLPKNIALIIPISNVALLNAHFPEKISELITKLCLHDHQVILELSENLFLYAQEDILKKIKNNKIQVCVKSEQLGLFSVKSLCEPPVSMISFDEEAVAKIKTNDVLTKNILSIYMKISETMKLKTLAHGVSSEDHLRLLLSSGCQLMDGNISGKAIDQNDLHEFIKKE